MRGLISTGALLHEDHHNYIECADYDDFDDHDPSDDYHSADDEEGFYCNDNYGKLLQRR